MVACSNISESPSCTASKEVIVLKLLFRFMKKYWYLALLASGFMIAEVYVDLYQPRMMALIVDEGILGLSSGSSPISVLSSLRV